MSTVNLLLGDNDNDDVNVHDLERTFKTGRTIRPTAAACDGPEAREILRKADVAFPKLHPILRDRETPCMNGLEFLSEPRSDAARRSAFVFRLSSSKAVDDRTYAHGHNGADSIVNRHPAGTLVEAVGLPERYRSIVERAG